MQIAYFQVCAQRERAKALEGFEAAKRKTIVGMQVLKDSCNLLSKLSSVKSISFAIMRAELGKIEVQFEGLRAEKEEVESRF